MSTASILAEIVKLPVTDQLLLVQRIWDNIAESHTPLDLTDAQKAELDRRAAELDADPQMAVRWEDVKRSLEERRIR